jgi:hypothetical protein
MANEKTNGDTVELNVGKLAAPTVDWDDSEMRSSYANVVNASSTREEVTVFFGTNQTWNPGSERKFKVKLQNRIILNPHAAKRLWILLGAILTEYEKRFGAISLEGSGSADSAASAGQAKT